MFLLYQCVVIFYGIHFIIILSLKYNVEAFYIIELSLVDYNIIITRAGVVAGDVVWNYLNMGPVPVHYDNLNIKYTPCI